MKKAQISIEFLFAIGVVFLIFLTLWLFTLSTQGKYARLDTDLKTKAECMKLGNLITYALITGATQSTTSAYDFTIVNSSRVIIMGATSCSLPINTVTSGSFSRGHFRIQPGTIVEVTNG